ncbi:ABC transporter substrate-binding protein [Lentzea sp. NBRC 102530]|uniref:ABC transporter substrate-binding protein n=1 Tax=Lentzea sp. NBRC 102530 TaxID=3032201 RepID=UPI0024A01C8B|nr:ABC transporter substrate-binding protein [Lentzea sp. NBRC 102530]GLY47723.1 ABC transporter substrate-binding protein [Lentzea sp. NBRC 102530]
MIRLLIVLVLLSALPACSGAGAAGKVQIMASWTGQEEQRFLEVLAEFEKDENVVVEYVGTRALSQVLGSEVRQGTPPDIALLPSPGELAAYARDGHLVPLDGIVPSGQDEYSAQWLALEKVALRDGGEQRFAVAVKADLKSAIWFNPGTLRSPVPRTGEELLALSDELAAGGRTPWCMGLGATPDSGWPGTDWIEDVLLHQAGPDVYRQWAASKLPWTSPQVREAWTTWSRLAGATTVRGGPKSALLTDFVDSGRALFGPQPGCLLDHQASFIMGVYQGYDTAPEVARDFDFFPFPAFAGKPPASVVSADLAAMFTDTPQARRLISYLASEKAQRIWPRNGGAFSTNRKVGPSEHRDDVSKKIATILTSDQSLCFDASDLMPPKMRTAFYRAVLEHVDDPSRLESLLEKLEIVRSGVPEEERVEFPCR